MAGEPLYTNLSGNPKDARVRIAPQGLISSITGGGPQIPIADPASFTQGQVYGAGPQLTRNEIVDQILSPAGKPLDGLPGKWQFGGGPLAFGSVDPANPLQLMALANLFGQYAFSTPVGTGTGYQVNNVGPYAVGATVIAVDTGAGTILANDVITFAGDGNKYTVVSTVGSPVTQVTIAAPGLQQTLADNVALTVATYNVWRFGLSEATAVKPWLTMQYNDQVVLARNYAGLLFNGFNLSAQPNQPFTLACPFLFHGFSEFGDVVQSVGSGSTKPVVTGTFDDNMAAEATDKDVYVLIVDASAKTLKAKTGLGAGAGTGYATATQTYTLGTPLRLRDQFGARMGNPEEQLKIYFPTGATLVTGDVFQVPRRRAPWSESLPTRRPISSVNVIFTIDGEEISIPGGVEAAAAWDAVYSQLDTGGNQGNIAESAGTLVHTVTPSRRITDLLFQKGVRTGAYVSCVIDALSAAYIGNTLRLFRFIAAHPRCLVTGPMYSTPAGGAAKDESPTLVAKDPSSDLTYDGYTFSDPCTVLIENNVANISALAA